MKLLILIILGIWIINVANTLRDPDKIDKMLDKLLQDKGVYDLETKKQFKNLTYLIYSLICAGVAFVFYIAYTSI